MRSPAAVDELPAIPGGWTTRTIVVTSRSFVVTRPADPDALLDDPAVLRDDRRDGCAPYWALLWPAALAMSAAIIRGDGPADGPVLEIGCGLGLVGLAACARGYDVTFTDHHPLAVRVALHNARLNGFDGARARRIDWREPPPCRYPSILGCDILYESADHEPILDLLERCLDLAGECRLADPGRSQVEPFLARARERRWTVELRDTDGIVVAAPVLGRFRLLTLTR